MKVHVMKNGFLSVAALLVAVCMLAGCGRPNTGGSDSSLSDISVSEAEFSLDALKTVGDAFAYDTQSDNMISEEYYAYSFAVNGEIYRVIADLPEDVAAKTNELDFMDVNYWDNVKKLVAPLEIRRAENLTEQMPSQEETEQLVGKTGKDLLDDGWTVSGWNLENMEFWMNHGVYYYTVIFDGSVENYDTFSDEDIAPFTIKSITIEGIGDALYME